MTDEKEKPKTKRLSGEAYWRLQDLLEDGDKKIKEYGEWARKKCRELKLLPDVTDFLQGVVWNEPENQRAPSPTRRQIANIEDEAAIEEAVRRQKEIDEINEKINALIKKVATAARVRRDQVNPRTGVITCDAEDVEQIEVDLS